MNLTKMDPLEARLATLDLRIDDTGAHLDDERLACIAEGLEASSSEARHLTGCDDCVSMLVLLAEGLEDLETWRTPAPIQAPSLVAPPRRWPLILAGLVFGAAAMAAAGWMISRSQEPALTPAVQPAKTPAKSNNATKAAPPVVPLVTTPASTSAPDTRLGASLVADEPVVAVTPSPAAPDARPRRPRAAAQPTLDLALDMDRGPRQIAEPISGPPRGYGRLRLNSRPRAKVFVDGKPYDWTPLVDLRLPEGPHDVRLVYDSALARVPEERFRVVIEADKTWKALRRNAKP